MDEERVVVGSRNQRWRQDDRNENVSHGLAVHGRLADGEHTAVNARAVNDGDGDPGVCVVAHVHSIDQLSPIRTCAFSQVGHDGSACRVNFVVSNETSVTSSMMSVSQPLISWMAAVGFVDFVVAAVVAAADA